MQVHIHMSEVSAFDHSLPCFLGTVSHNLELRSSVRLIREFSQIHLLNPTFILKVIVIHCCAWLLRAGDQYSGLPNEPFSPASSF